ncbi:MAG: hypothetical protein HWN65_01170 [Candidatus Helarchaeota archaeon]|nr:hypothetical protein [Candidatus Helarchaeota archaeon]
MSSDAEKPQLKWLVKFKFKEDYTNLLVDLKDTTLFDEKYPVFRMLLAREILASKVNHFFHVKREEYPTEIKDPSGKELPQDSCIFIFGVSTELGMLKALFLPQPEERLVLVGIDEVWINVLEKIQESQRLTVLTNVLASLVNKSDAWTQVYLVY